jgi:hypothetical protein
MPSVWIIAIHLVEMVLGNHDFHLLACALGDKTPSNKDTFSDILNAKDKGKLINTKSDGFFTVHFICKFSIEFP